MNTQNLSTLQVFQSLSRKCKSHFLQSWPKEFVRFLCECIVYLLKAFFWVFLCKSWGLFATKWLPSECCDKNWQNESENNKFLELQRLLPNMESTYIYGNVRVIRSELIETVGIFHKWKYCHKRRSHIIRLTINTSLLFPKNFISLFSPK